MEFQRTSGRAILILACLAAFPINSHADEASAIRMISEAGGSIVRRGDQPKGAVVGVTLGGGGRGANEESFWRELRSLTELEALDLGGSPKSIRAAPFDALKTFAKLRTLNLNHCLLEDSGLEGLQELPQLQMLSLCGVEEVLHGYGRYDPEIGLDLSPLRGCLKLRELNLSSIPDLGPLKDLPHLQTLRFDIPYSSVEIDPLRAAVSKLKSNLLLVGKFPSLTTVDLPLSDTVLTAFREAGILHKHGRATAANGARPKRVEDVISFDLHREFTRFDINNGPSLRFTPVSDEGLKVLTDLRNLQSLDLSDTLVTDAGLATLRTFSQLRSVRIRYDDLRILLDPDSQLPRISDDGMKILAGVSTLRSLTLEKCRLTDRGMAELRSLGSMHRLMLRTGFSLDGVTDVGLDHVAALTELRSLAFRESKITGAGLKKLQNLAHLQELNLQSTSLTAADLSILSQFAGLKKLRLGLKKIAASDLAPLAGLKDLETLEFPDATTIADGTWQALRDCRKLTRIRMSPDCITDGTLKSLREAGLLQTLDAVSSYELPDWSEEPGADDNSGPVRRMTLPMVTDAGVAELRDLHELEQLEFSRVLGPGLKELAGLRRLKTLNIAVTDAVVVALGDIDRIHILVCAISHEGGRPVNAADVARFDPITTQQFFNPSLTGVGLRALKPLVNLHTLQYVTFSHHLNDSLTTLAEIGLLHTLPQALAKDGRRPVGPDDVVILDLSGTGFTDAGLKQLTAFKNLKVLYLAGTQVFDLMLLAPLKNLEWLDVSGTKDGDGKTRRPKGIIPLSDALPLLRIRS